MSLAFYLEIMIGGLLTGLVYGLGALGLSVIYGALRLVNFAHGGLMVAGMYGAALITAGRGGDPLVAAPVVAAGLFVLGFVFERALLSRSAPAPEPMPSLLMLGAALALGGGLTMLSALHPAAVAAAHDGLMVGPFRLDRMQVRAAWVAVMVITLLFLFFNVSRTGKAIRACADNPLGARVIGLNVPLLRAITFGLGAAVTGVAGCLLAGSVEMRPALIPDCALTGFVIVLAGGLGNAGGALLAGMGLGMAEALAGVLIGPALHGLIGIGLLTLLLVARPQMLAGRPQ